MLLLLLLWTKVVFFQLFFWLSSTIGWQKNNRFFLSRKLYCKLYAFVCILLWHVFSTDAMQSWSWITIWRMANKKKTKKNPGIILILFLFIHLFWSCLRRSSSKSMIFLFSISKNIVNLYNSKEKRYNVRRLFVYLYQ